MAKFIRPHLNLGYEQDRADGVNGLPELIAFNAKYNPDLVFGRQMRTADGSYREITFAELHQAVERCSAWLISSGATKIREPGCTFPKPVGILLGSDVTIFIFMAALLRIGTPVLCLSARLTPVAVAHLLKATSASTILYSAQVSRIIQELQADSDSELKVNFQLALGYDAFMDAQHPELSELTIPEPYVYTVRHELGAVVMHSSGTTGLPKPIYHAPAYILGYAACHELAEPSERFGYNVSTLPLYHGFGLLAPTLALSIGLPFVLPPATMIPTARTTLATLKAAKAQSMLSVPSILEDILNSSDPDAMTVLKSLDFIAIGGAPMKESVAEQLVAQGVKLLNHWGATEIGAIAVVQRPPADYDWHYLIPRRDLGLEVVPVDPSDPNTSYRLIGHPQGWSGAFHVQDLLVRNPDAPSQLRIMGRADDLIVLATGEKVRPTGLERAVSEHPSVKDALVFGVGQPALGLLIELHDTTKESVEEVMESLTPYLERGNALTDAHGKVTPNMIIFTKGSDKPLKRTDKGSLARKESYAAFDEEIKACYERAELADAEPFPTNDETALRSAVRNLVVNCATTAAVDFSDGSKNDSLDFFEVGMDSLQATRLRRMIQSALIATQLATKPVLPSDFCFQNSSITKLTAAVSGILSGISLEDAAADRDTKRVQAMHDMVAKYTEELKSYAALAQSTRNAQPREVEGKVVLLTGSTGSLGCMLLEKLSGDPSVQKLFCLNRPRAGGAAAAKAYQMSAIKKRGAVVKDENWSKVVFLEATTGADNLGLDDSQYQQLLEVTHIIHNAWPVDFNRNLSSFEPHVKAVSNLAKLCLQTSVGRPKRILFASSIAVVGNYPTLNADDDYCWDIPETVIDARATDDFGYPEAKWVCEMVLEAANTLYGAGDKPLLRGSSVRIGQMTGPEGIGAWNESEHFPIICKTSQLVKALPALSGSLSWMPVNRAANVIVELLFSRNFRPFYHMENPARQSWSGILGNLSTILAGSRQEPLPLIPFTEWVERVKALGSDPSVNTALKIMQFLQHDFIRMAAGTVILSTKYAKEDSPTMVRSTAVDKKHLEEYCTYWRSVNSLI
ncbi:hypothetical protein VNI00_004116 [Paramarasmius palmivorus]|uniref:Carrier domain-containing protein n=1 Tax=Paramarasmius palmivorus TaxID=297713 RepID=A0AAW0DPL8_9AGAR